MPDTVSQEEDEPEEDTGPMPLNPWYYPNGDRRAADYGQPEKPGESPRDNYLLYKL